MPRAGEPGKECLDFAASHGHRVTAIIEPDNGATPRSRVALANKPDKSFNSIQIGLSGARAVVSESQAGADLVQQSGRPGDGKRLDQIIRHNGDLWDVDCDHIQYLRRRHQIIRLPHIPFTRRFIGYITLGTTNHLPDPPSE